MKRNLIIILLLIIPFITGCENKEKIHEHCTRSATAGENVDVKLEYELYYKDDVLLKLESVEQITSEEEETLDLYESAYRNIHNNYANLKYYDTNIERKDNTVTSKIVIDYKRIDIDKLIEIEGEEDNIFEDKIPKASKWKELAKKLGAKCEVVED